MTSATAHPHAVDLSMPPSLRVAPKLDSNMAIFGILFAIWVLIDQSFFPQWQSQPPALLTAPLAGLVLLRPNSVKLLLLMLAASLWSFLWRAPFFVNNVLIGAFFESLILGTSLIYVIKHKRLPATLRELEAEVFPTIRVGVVVIFLFAVLHKTNSAFMNPAMSCALIHYRMLHGMVPWFSPSPDAPGVGQGMCYLTWCTEISIPIILTLGWAKLPTRKLVTFGIIIALGFHFVMSFNGYQNFSAMALAYYVPYLPENFYKTISALLVRLSRGKAGKAIKVLTIVCGGALAVFAFELMAYAVFKNLRPNVKAHGQTFLRNQGWVLFNIGAPFVSLLFAWLSLKRAGRRNVMPGAYPPIWTYALFAVVILSSLSPYLGLKTENSFAMFSNLLTEGDKSHWNNLVMPVGMRVFHFQDHLVSVKAVTIAGKDAASDLSDLEEADNAIGANLPGLRSLQPDSKFRMVEFEFRRNVGVACKKYKQPIAIDYDIDGVAYHVDDAHKVPDLANGNGYFLEKIMFFRKVPNSPYGICLH